VSAGKLDRIIGIEVCSTANDTYGGQVHTWTPVRNEFANYYPGTGSERRIALQEVAELAATFTVRFNALTSALGPQTHRLTFDGSNWDIASVVEKKRGAYIEILARRRTS